MKCHYEVLGVPRDADDGEIKIAYRKLALRWHPDKNLDDPEEAKEQFQQVQQSYEVLSDPHERAWYDNHREQILRGRNTDYQENCLDLFQYFTVSCFKGYGDDVGSFYHVYADVFERISSEDAEFMDDEEQVKKIPKFGDSQSNYEETVAPFYAYWQSYCTKKNYAWLCPYNINEIKDRRILREIEKDMKKIVQKARKERNEEVRNLVSFVRKRDKRVQAYKKLLEDRAVANRQKQEQIRIEQLKKRKKEIEEAQKKVNLTMDDSYEEQLQQLEQEYDSENEEFSNSIDENDDEISDYDGEKNSVEEYNSKNYTVEKNYDNESSLFCIACDKIFSNENAYINHQSSKKHKLNVQVIKDSFREEKEELDKHRNIDSDTEVEKIKSDAVELEELNNLSKQKNKKNKKSKKPQLAVSDCENVDEFPGVLEEIDIEKDNWDDNTKFKKKSKKGTQKKPALNQSASHNESCCNETPKETEKFEIKETTQTDVNHTCITCKATFESKNKLFAHLKKANHGVYIPKKNAIAIGNQKEKSKKGKRNK